MSEVHSIIGFKLPCRICGEDFLVGAHSEPFAEARTGTMLTGYWSADAENEAERPIGYSEGAGDNFECKWCHAVKWVGQVKEMDAAHDH